MERYINLCIKILAPLYDKNPQLKSTNLDKYSMAVEYVIIQQIERMKYRNSSQLAGAYHQL